MLNLAARAAEVQGSIQSAGGQPLSVQNAAEMPDKQTSAEKKTVSKASLDVAVKKLNEALETVMTEQRFEIDSELNRPIVKVVNSKTKEVIRQIPSEEAVRLSKNIGEMIGLLMDDKI